jgi:isopenicillin-N epimerase
LNFERTGATLAADALSLGDTIDIVDSALLEAFGLDPDVLHLNHGAFGVAPVAVRRAAAAWRDRAERNPHRFNRVEVPGLIAAARERAAGFLGVDPSRAAWVRNVSEGVSAVLGSMELRPGDELVTSTHGYGAVRKALDHHAGRAGARVVEAVFPVGASDEEIVSAYTRACSSRTRLVVVDRITSPTATVVPVAAVATAVAAVGADVRVLVDAAHAPGQLRDDIAALGADHWIGNLHKWAYTPRGSAILWSRPGASVTPTVLSWQLEDGYPESFDYPGTWDYAGWLAVGDGLAYWEALGGWDAVSGLASLVTEGQKNVAEAFDVSLDGLPVTPAPAMRLVPLPSGVLTSPGQIEPFYEALSQQRVEVAPVHFDGIGYLRVAAAPYNTRDDYDRLASAVRELLDRHGSDGLRRLHGAAEEGSQPVDGRCAVGYGLLGCERPGGSAAELVPRLGEAAGGDVIGEVWRLAGGAGQVPAVAEELGDPDARQRGARHPPERQRVGPCPHARRAQRGGEQVGGRAEREKGVIAEVVGVADGRFGPGDHGDEGEVP